MNVFGETDYKNPETRTKYEVCALKAKVDASKTKKKGRILKELLKEHLKT